ncbi:primosome assembly protein PriA [Arthrobacter sp. Hiyo8]|nr:primosome assembly protein PriA [Arthrobacter sp. Hiyo8]
MTGKRADVVYFTESLADTIQLRTAGPAPVSLALSAQRASGRDDDPDVRTLIFIPYAQAVVATRSMRAVKAASAAKRTSGPVQLRLDGVDVL